MMLAKWSSAPPGSSRWQEQHKNIPQFSPSSLSSEELWLRAKLGSLADENQGNKTPLDPSSLAPSTLPKINKLFSPCPLSPNAFLGEKKKKNKLSLPTQWERPLKEELNPNKIWAVHCGEAATEMVGFGLRREFVSEVYYPGLSKQGSFWKQSLH